jgi:hypothetical protein
MNNYNKISEQLTNFVSKMNSSGVYLKDMRVISDDDLKLTYRVPVMAFGVIMGYDHYVMERISNNDFYFYQMREGKNGTVVQSGKKKLTGDQNESHYQNMLTEI